MRLQSYLNRYRIYFTNIYLSNINLGQFTINGEPIPSPTQFKIEPLDLTKRARTASGMLLADTKPVKHRFILWYRLLTPEQVAILRQIPLNKPVAFTYPGGETMVFCSEFPRELLSADPILWQNITLTLEEQ